MLFCGTVSFLSVWHFGGPF